MILAKILDHHEEDIRHDVRRLSPRRGICSPVSEGKGTTKPRPPARKGRHRSTVCREPRRNGPRSDGRYRATTAQERTKGRRARSRRNGRFSAEDFSPIDELLCRRGSPEQAAGHLRRAGLLPISHGTIYRHAWRDKKRGGTLCTHLRGARKRRRKHYGAYDSRGRPAGKRMISGRPPEVEARERVGHWEADTVMGAGSKDCVLTLVERKTGPVLDGKLADRTKDSFSRRAIDTRAALYF